MTDVLAEYARLERERNEWEAEAHRLKVVALSDRAENERLREQRDTHEMRANMAEGVAANLEAENERLRDALQEAHRRLSRFEDKGPKQVGRAMMGIEAALGDQEALGDGWGSAGAALKACDESP